MEKQKFNSDNKINFPNNNIENENNNNNINKKNSNIQKISKDLFFDLSNELYNNIKCTKCYFIPLIPIVLKLNSLEQNSDNYEVFCKDCFTQLSLSKKNVNINNIDKQYSLNIKLLIDNCKVKCINNKSGCQWENLLSNLVSHLNDECLYSEMKCPNNECDKVILKKDLDYHLSQCDFTEKIMKAKCKFCKKEFGMANFSQHLRECPENIIECDKGCKSKFKKKELEDHKKNKCPEVLIKCNYWDKGCKKLIKRKFLSDHYKLEKNNHLNLDKKFNEIRDVNIKENKENILPIDNYILPIKKEEDSLNLSEVQIIQDLDIFNNNRNNNDIVGNINDNIVQNNQKDEEKKKLKGYDNYIPFTSNSLTFITQNENFKKKIFLFEYKKIKYSGNYFKNLEFEKYYILLSRESLDLNSTTIFQFKIYPPCMDDSSDPLPLPWIAFGLYVLKTGEKINYNNIYFPDENFKCIDLNSTCYLNGKIALYKGPQEIQKINTNGYILMSFIPKENSLKIEDNFNLKINFTIEAQNNISDVRFCFVFKGKDRAIIDYDY